MADITRRFRAEDPATYSSALIMLTEYARLHQDAEYGFGPVQNVRALWEHGLTVSGPAAVVETLSDLLAEQVPGLYEVDALGAAWQR